jgi:MFS family permease
MKTTRRRYWVFLLLFLFNAVAYVDRVNMSVAGKQIAHEFGLSPVALGYLFSSFLWAYVLMMLPGGRLIDRWGMHIMASAAAAVWSAAQMATGAAGSFTTMLLARLVLQPGFRMDRATPHILRSSEPKFFNFTGPPRAVNFTRNIRILDQKFFVFAI